MPSGFGAGRARLLALALTVHGAAWSIFQSRCTPVYVVNATKKVIELLPDSIGTGLWRGSMPGLGEIARADL